MAQTDDDVRVQLIVNLVALTEDNRVVLTRYDPDDERWWLPGAELEPCEHPDEVAARIAADVSASCGAPRLHHLESFRGRRGWHLMFNYAAQLPAGAGCNAGHMLHAASALPRTFHGDWEAKVVAHVLQK